MSRKGKTNGGEPDGGLRLAVLGVVAAAGLLLSLGPLCLHASAQSRGYLVRSGDTLAAIARRNRVSVSALRRANRMRDDTLHPGQRLRIPARGGEARERRGEGPWQHRVEAGDTLVRLAMRYRVRSRDIRLANRMRGTQLRVGEVLIIPRPGQNPRQARSQAGVATPPPPEVRESEARAISMERAHTHNLGALHVGQRLLLGPPERLWIAAARQIDEEQEAAPVAASTSTSEEGGVSEENSDLDAGAEENSDLDAGVPDAGAPEDAGAAPNATPRPSSAAADTEGTLLLPVEGGTFIRGWGSGANGYHLAIDIRANVGTPTLAAERGVVAYAGDGIRGYGNMVILVHPNGLVTAYAHHDRNLVIAGQLVSRGEQLGEVGMTGYARGPHLHFILVHNGEHCDPVPLFRPRIRYATGRRVEGGSATWYRIRPSGVRCLPRSARPNRRWQRRRERERTRRQRRQARQRRRERATEHDED